MLLILVSSSGPTTRDKLVPGGQEHCRFVCLQPLQMFDGPSHSNAEVDSPWKHPCIIGVRRMAGREDRQCLSVFAKTTFLFMPPVHDPVMNATQGVSFPLEKMASLLKSITHISQHLCIIPDVDLHLAAKLFNLIQTQSIKHLFTRFPNNS